MNDNYSSQEALLIASAQNLIKEPEEAEKQKEIRVKIDGDLSGITSLVFTLKK